ncbi:MULTISPECIES: DUF1642 domain-containing protein [Lacticaseibacillus]|uniref:DUF1642 domain-containing protein n=2 Tax=root TaxID=1 RepID=Q6J1U8_9CAUD|nr:DUF1642 domain-containing protein [Lacticaseibacillus casei]YP_025065.1 DUF1642 domain-containing protein [Lactobacillus phage phiAT3]AAT36525.1 unknown [Lactobacillus phage phiAT3]MBI6598694.1 DUF1642 domain-containing protein [Lacticaseibacillus casei]MBO1482436.1 DUF1642 domain-containing protein [Lacticaseibacillus casei]MBO2417744.1 DUF1642 domain-containing protein [Lacticaseibacillus casei]MCK2082006.1 DUF1642 domain-containing protein [Lacticaseibacillus casei]
MSEEKLYAVKNDEGEWLDQDHIFGPGAWATPDKDEREKVAKCYGGHVVALVEEPKKVVLTEEQAEIVEGARDSAWPANYISGNGANEELLMNAYVNGYTVAKEKKYNVKVPHAEGWHFQKYSSASKLGVRNNWRPFPAKDIDSNMSKELFQFTEAEIEHYGLQDCEKEEVTDDEQ